LIKDGRFILTPANYAALQDRDELRLLLIRISMQHFIDNFEQYQLAPKDVLQLLLSNEIVIDDKIKIINKTPVTFYLLISRSLPM
jgi:hypothetical protein